MVTKKQLQAWRRENWGLLLLLLVALLLSIFIWYRVNDALGSNLVAGILGSAFTVFGLDYLIRLRDRRQRLPLRVAAYEEVRVLTRRALDLFKRPYEEAVGTDPTSWHDFLSDKRFHELVSAWDVSTPAFVTPPRPWWAQIDAELDFIQSCLGKVLNRYGGVLDPAAYRSVAALEYYGAITRRVFHDAETNGGVGMPVPGEWRRALLELYDWTVSEFRELDRAGVTDIYEPYQFGAFVRPEARKKQGWVPPQR